MKMPEIISFLFHDHSILRRHPTVGLELPVPPLKLSRLSRLNRPKKAMLYRYKIQELAP